MSHYYLQDGAPKYTIKGANGKRRDTNLRDARKLGLYPSVTEVKKAILVEDFLQQWLREQIAEFSFDNRPTDLETKEEYTSRVIYGGNHRSRTACDFGNTFHDTAENYAADKSIKIPFEVFPFWGTFKKWFDENVEKVIATELATTACQFGIGGSIDLICMVKGVGLCVVDFKTQSVATKTYKTEPYQRKVPSWYPGWIQQLGLYSAMYEIYKCEEEADKVEVAKALSEGIWLDSAPQCMSVVIDSNEPGFVQPKLWSPEERDWGLQLGLSCIRTWQIAKKYKPAGSIL